MVTHPIRQSRWAPHPLPAGPARRRGGRPGRQAATTEAFTGDGTGPGAGLMGVPAPPGAGERNRLAAPLRPYAQVVPAAGRAATSGIGARGGAGRRPWGAWAIAARLALLAAAPVLANEAPASEAAPHAPYAFEGHLRERSTFRSAFNFDRDAHEAGWFWTQRLALTASASLGSRSSATATLLSALQEGADINPVKRNNLDVQQAFVTWDDGPLRLRAGRQELNLGSQRLVGWREGTNVRRTWDGVRASWAGTDATVELLALQIVEVEMNGAFNDRSSADQWLGGAYATLALDATDLDLYYLLAEFPDRSTVAGTARQHRHSVGARAFGERGPWFWNWEAVRQFGRHGELDIAAWTLASNTGYRFDAPGSPELMLSANVASGDRDPNDGKLGTFDALYARASYFSERALLYPANFYNVNPYLRLHPTERLALSFDLNLFWRLETADGVYGPPGTLIREPGGSTAHHVNTAFSASAEWELSERLRAAVLFTHSIPERFIRETGPASHVNFLELALDVRF